MVEEKKYSEENLRNIIENSLSYADVLRDLNLAAKGGNYKTLQKYIKIYNIDISHFTGQRWNVGDKYQPVGGNYYTLDEILIENSPYKSTGRLKKRLINDGLLEYKCDECGLDEWLGKEIVLQLDHINGINDDNRLENLRLLCPNCHSQTDTFCRSNNPKYTNPEKICGCGNTKKTSSKVCVECYKNRYKEKGFKRYDMENNSNFCECGNKKHKNSKQCSECQHLKYRKVKNRPSKEELLKELVASNYSAMGRKYGVSDNTIRKWMK